MHNTIWSLQGKHNSQIMSGKYYWIKKIILKQEQEQQMFMFAYL